MRPHLIGLLALGAVVDRIQAMTVTNDLPTGGATIGRNGFDMTARQCAGLNMADVAVIDSGGAGMTRTTWATASSINQREVDSEVTDTDDDKAGRVSTTSGGIVNFQLPAFMSPPITGSIQRHVGA